MTKACARWPECLTGNRFIVDVKHQVKFGSFCSLNGIFEARRNRHHYNSVSHLNIIALKFSKGQSTTITYSVRFDIDIEHVLLPSKLLTFGVHEYAYCRCEIGFIMSH